MNTFQDLITPLENQVIFCPTNQIAKKIDNEDVPSKSTFNETCAKINMTQPRQKEIQTTKANHKTQTTRQKETQTF